jgi:hypothetical protein
VPRYAVVAAEAGMQRPDDDLHVADRIQGSANTDFGVPHEIAPRDAAALSGAALKRTVALVKAAWVVLDRVAAGAPAELRKGPRGGGRDRDKIVEHVYGAEAAYARPLGLRLRQPALGDSAAVQTFRDALIDGLEHPRDGAKWPPAYAARRIAWHTLDHAWEIEDRSS